MSNFLLLGALFLPSLILSTEAESFTKAYIQNAKSGKCITFTDDTNLENVFATKCECGKFQLWKTSGDQIISEGDSRTYLDQLYGNEPNGLPIGIYGYTGSNWQRWTIEQAEDGTYTFVVKQTKKCMRQSSAGKIEQWDCDDGDQSQKWNVVEDVCTNQKPLEPASFKNAYLQNADSQKCVSFTNDKNLEEVLGAKCKCEKFQLWTTKGDQVISDGDSSTYLDQLYGNDPNGKPIGIYGYTGSLWQRWRLYEYDDGNFAFVVKQTKKCMRQGEDNRIEQWDCDDNDQTQRWRVVKWTSNNPCKKAPPSKPGPTRAPRKDSFTNAYIQNAKSGKCVTFTDDTNLENVFATKCECGKFQLWKTSGDQIISEGDTRTYLDQLYGNEPNGLPIGIYGYTGSNWQRWTIEQAEDGTYTFVVKQTKKCMRQGSAGKIEQWDCDDGDQSQKWNVVEDVCSDKKTLEPASFANAYLQNADSQKCVSFTNDKNLEEVLGAKCKCDKFQLWTTKGDQVISEGDSSTYLDQLYGNDPNGKPIGIYGYTGSLWQRWRLYEYDDGNFAFVVKQTKKCMRQGEDNRIEQWDCDDNDQTQRWRVVKWTSSNPCKKAPPPTPAPTPAPPTKPPPTSPAPTPPTTTSPAPTSPPQPTNVIPSYLVYFFESGLLNWLNPTRYHLLFGGHWDATTSTWYTADGRHVKPGTEEWKLYFGKAQPSFLTSLFAGGKTWNDTFGWMTSEFFETWNQWKTPPTTPPQTKNVIPQYLVSFFNGGQMNWLTPERYNLLIGGRWDASTMIWHTANGRQIRPLTQEWTTYFGDLQPSQLNVFFPSGGSWNDAFGWLSASFFDQWTGWKKVDVTPRVVRINIVGHIPTATRQLFGSGRVNWLTPNRVQLLAGGQWTGYDYVTRTKAHVTPGSPMWDTYFGSADSTEVNTLFGGPALFDMNFGWLIEAVKDVPLGNPAKTFAWNSVFKQ